MAAWPKEIEPLRSASPCISRSEPWQARVTWGGSCGEHEGHMDPRAGEHEGRMGPRAGEHEGRMGPRAGEHEGRMGPRAGGSYIRLLPLRASEEHRTHQPSTPHLHIHSLLTSVCTPSSPPYALTPHLHIHCRAACMCVRSEAGTSAASPALRNCTTSPDPTSAAIRANTSVALGPPPHPCAARLRRSGVGVDASPAVNGPWAPAVNGPCAPAPPSPAATSGVAA